jgi:predicted RNA methylase
LPDNKMSGSYFEQKISYLERVLEFLKKEQKAIQSSNLEAINASIKSIEELQVEIDNLDRKYLKSKVTLEVRESKQLKELLIDILDLSKTNGKLLLKLKESVLTELKTTRLKKNARSVYGDSAPVSELAHRIG